VDGTNKLIQDLKNWMLEPKGTDPFHPSYGSILDGGVQEDGSYSASTIGNMLTSEDLMMIEGEIRRILRAYQRQQLDRLSRESVSYGRGKNTLSIGEILLSVNNVNVWQIGDTAIVEIHITTGSGNLVTFNQPLTR